RRKEPCRGKGWVFGGALCIKKTRRSWMVGWYTFPARWAACAENADSALVRAPVYSTPFIVVGGVAQVAQVALGFFSSRRRHTRFKCDWSSDVCSSDLQTRMPFMSCPFFHSRNQLALPD